MTSSSPSSPASPNCPPTSPDESLKTLSPGRSLAEKALVAGLILGGAYLLSGKVLWTSILAHGFIDTFGVLALYMGWDS